MKTVVFLMLLISTCKLYGQDQFVDVGGHKFHVFTKDLTKRKPDQPVFILENGMGMDLGNWNSIINELAEIAPVFSYDRAGVGKSETIYRMPTIREVADNLKSILNSLNITPPYILIGHSMGGLYARSFAGYYPDDVAGMVLLDPADFTETKENWNDIFRQLAVPEARINEMLYERLYKPSKVDSARFGPSSELQVLTALRRTDFAEVASLPVPKAPIYFLIGGKFEVPAERQSRDYNHPKFFEIRTEVNIARWRKFINLSPMGGVLLYISKSGHYLHHDEPKAVIGAVKMMTAPPEPLVFFHR